MTDLDRIAALERHITENRRLFEKAVAPATASMSTITCPYCAACFSFYLNFSRHLKSCKDSKNRRGSAPRERFGRRIQHRQDERRQRIDPVSEPRGRSDAGGTGFCSPVGKPEPRKNF